jgi:hypothetical protein
MAVSGADSAVENRILTTTLARYSPQISNEIARNDGVVSVFALDGRIKIVDGGERAIETLDVSENPNIAFRDRYTNIPIAKSDTRKQAKYAWATIDGAITVNAVDLAMNSGDRRIYNLQEEDVDNAKRTLVRKVADALRAASPAATDPESVRTIIPDTATASQTTTTGELSRTTNTWWRSQYSNTAMSLNAAAGLQSLIGFYLDSCSKGTSKLDQPNFGLTTGTLFAALGAGHGDANRRFAPDDRLARLGFPNIVVMNATIIADPSVTAGDLYFINTMFAFLQVLRTPGIVDIGEKPQSLPVSVGEFQNAIDSLHKIALLYLTFAFTCSSLQRQGIATNCS